MIGAPEDVPGWVSPEYGGGGGPVIGNWWRVPPVDGLSFDPPMVGTPIDPTLNSDPPSASVQPTAAATQNEAAESIDANFVLIGAAVVLGVILLTTGKD